MMLSPAAMQGAVIVSRRAGVRVVVLCAVLGAACSGSDLPSGRGDLGGLNAGSGGDSLGSGGDSFGSGGDLFGGGNSTGGAVFGTGGRTDTGPPDNVCEEVRLDASAQIPEIMIVLDRSGSMGREGRWQPSVSALRSITTQLEGRVDFGLAMFPGMGGFDGGSCDAGGVVVQPAPKNAANIGNSLTLTFPGGGTPTGPILDSLADDWGGPAAALDTMSQPRFVLLVTDGQPTCPAGGGTTTAPADVDASNAAIDKLLGNGVKTYVIGYDTSGAANADLAAVLDEFAVRGGTGDTMHRPVESEASLVMELEGIAGNIAGCTFTLDQTPADASYVQVILDGGQVNLNDPDGWVLNGSTIELQGAACAQLKSPGDHMVSATVQCQVVPPD